MIFDLEDKGKFKIVSITKRTMVAILDLIIYSIILGLLFLVCVFPFNEKNSSTNNIDSLLTVTQIYIWSPLPFVMVIIYYVLLPKWLRNKTIACWILGTRIYGQDNPKVSIFQYFKRAFFFVIFPTVTYWIIMYLFINEISSGATFTELLKIDKKLNNPSSETAKKIFARTIVLATSILFIITNITPLFSRRRLGINDMFSSTAMVYALPYISPIESIMPKPKRMPGDLSTEELRRARELKV